VLLDQFFKGLLDKEVMAMPLETCHLLSKITSRLVPRESSNSYLMPHEVIVNKKMEADLDFEEAFSNWMNDLFIQVKKNYAPPLNEILALRFPKSQHAKIIFQMFYDRIPNIRSAIKDNFSNEYLAVSLIEVAMQVGLGHNDLCDNGDRLKELLGDNAGNGTAMAWRFFKCSYENPKYYGNTPHLTSYFRYRPDLIKSNIETIISGWNQWNLPKGFLKLKALLSFYELNKLISDAVRIKVHDESVSWFQKMHVPLVYSETVTLSEYLDELGKYIPEKSSVDANSILSNSFITVPATRCLRNLKPPSELFSLVVKYLVGGSEMLLPALPAFHKACFNSHLQVVKGNITPLLQHPVSVLKKAVGTLSTLLPRKSALEAYGEVWARSVHYSARTIVLKHLVNMFLDDPSPQVWNLLKLCLSDVDEPLFSFIPNLDQVPDDYLDGFLDTILNRLAHFYGNEAADAAKAKIIRKLSSRVQLLSNEKCEGIIEDAIFTPGCQVDHFTICYLATDSDQLLKKLEFLNTLLRERVGAHPCAVINFVYRIARADNRYVHIFIKEFVELSGDVFERPELFEAKWVLKILYFSQDTWENKKINVSLLPGVGKKVAQLWLTQKDRQFFFPLLAKAIVRVFEIPLHLHAFLSGVIGDDDELISVVAMCLPKNHNEIEIRSNDENALYLSALLKTLRASESHSVQFFNKV